MTYSVRSEASRAVISLDGVDRVAFNEDGSMELLTPAANPTGNKVPVASQLPTVGQTIQDVTGSRAKATPYTNSTGKEIWVTVNPAATASATSSITVNGVVVQSLSFGSSTVTAPLCAPVPSGGTYQFDSTTTILRWVELR